MRKEDQFTFEDLSKVFAYDPKSGKITWRVATRNTKIGDEAGGISVVRKCAGGAYRYVGYKGGHIQGVRLAWLLGHGEWPPQQVGVKDGSALNLALDNLFLRHTVKGAFLSKAEYHAARHREHPHLKRITHLNRSFDMSLAEYSAMVADQDNKCAICGSEETDARRGKLLALAVDHNHETGKVRGLLCGACNKGIGLLKDDCEVLLKAVKYLDSHSEPKKEIPMLKILSTEKG